VANLRSILLNRAAVVAAVAAVALAIVATRVAVAARTELDRAMALLSQDAPGPDELDDAILHLRRAASWGGLPGSSIRERALDTLEELARAAEADDRAALALHAWRSVGAGMMAGRSVLTGDVRRRPRFRRVVSAVRRLAGEPEARALTAPGPRPGGILLAVGGFATWVAGAVVFLTRAFDELGRLRRPFGRPAALGAAAVLLGLASFLAGLALT